MKFNEACHGVITSSFTTRCCLITRKKCDPVHFNFTKRVKCRFLIDYSLHQKKVSTCGKAEYSKTRVSTGKVGGASHSQWSWSKVDQASFWYSKRWRHFFEFQNEALPSLDQLNGWFGAPPIFHLAPSFLNTRLDKSVYFLLGGL